MTKKLSVSALNLGHMDFASALSVQQKHARHILDNLKADPVDKCSTSHVPYQNTLLLVEHDPVYTVGIRSKDDKPNDEIILRSLGAEFFRTNRGGLITFHGPGQLVAYPVLYLKDFRLGMKSYIECLERTLIQTCDHFGINAHTSPDTGVWVGDRKIAAIGVHGSRYVTTHGISLNCNTNLTWFEHIVPCGLEGKGVTSLSIESNHETTVSDTINPFINAFCEQFKCDVDTSTVNRQNLSDFIS